MISTLLLLVIGFLFIGILAKILKFTFKFAIFLITIIVIIALVKSFLIAIF